MLQRILGVVLVLAGLGAIAFGVATATVLRESDSVVATARPAGDGTLVVTDPGVLGLVDSEVTVTASVPEGQEVAVVVGREVDVAGWLGEDAYTRVTGLSDWETLSTEQVAGAADEEAESSEDGEEGAEAEPPPNPAGSDMWDTELVDAEQVSLRWTDRPGRWVLLAAATGAAPAEESEGEDAEAAEADEAAPAEAPTLELTWDRDVSTPLLWPAVGVGGVLLIIGLVLLAMSRRTTRSRKRRTAGATAGAAATTVSSSGTTSPGTGTPSGTSPFGPAVGAGAGAATARSGGTWPGAAAASPNAPHDDGTTAAAEDAPTQGTDPQDAAGGTDQVPVAGRFRRRTRLRRDADPADAREAPVPAPEPSAGGAPVPAPAPALPTAPASSADTAGSDDTAARPLTRRELRRREEERKAAEQSGMGGMGRALRALTGQTPVVPRPGGTSSPSAADPGGAQSAADRRASAWRETWGFGGTTAAGTPTSDDDTSDEDKR
ncbi:hypothetical protein [Isoptericola sp. b408]|uniref:hypothetical protein n=1 Tax=Isoptericola sp. b408 TaxID=3064653 RepID=UPI0027136FFE|nr:hypothetical protein [Isoptericola sp. b408]MDO8150816.1 hypothetical protein [Isoptericola sp. b408]